MVLKSTLLLSFFLAAGGGASAADDSKTVALSDTPATVQKAITGHIAGGQLGDIDKTSEGGETVFVASFTNKAGVERDFTVADDGTLLSEEMTFAEVPAAVQQAIRQEATGWQLVSIDKNLDDTEISYDVETTKGDKTEKFTVAEDGDTLSEVVPLSATPAPVQTAIKTRVADGLVIAIDQIFQPEGSTFEVEATTKNGVSKSFSVSTNGQVLTEEITLEKLSPGARKTIETKVGDGKVLHVEKSLAEKKDGVLPFKVQARKDGKSFDFLVGPRGRFLGMDN